MLFDDTKSPAGTCPTREYAGLRQIKVTRGASDMLRRSVGTFAIRE
ncbi:hypothetical protein BOS5A_230189 [Bosea sp. EC-HK365B]|nr:hypothetical protein BOSE21B_90266 [Bosea sp. 21B]CAD5298557.1 hypothetical protein BOSE7B_60400 [Bosea sp. 7B]VVT60912.1 hypothetical protein BOS5A_230189 [Bosea sp. EC-HK365B]VXB36757.1 hypothetical protein BOSE127_110399 [Bosea sp. 127]